MRTPTNPAVSAGVMLVVLLSSVVGLQALRERVEPAVASDQASNLLYVRSPEAMKRLALSYQPLLADVYWIRAVQHFGRTKLSTNPEKRFELLYPLLDLTTSLDPHFNIAYRFGAIFLAEPPPGGPGRTDHAIALLQKGLAAQPHRWQYAQDIGFVHYWWERDYTRAAEWFKRAASIEGAPTWMAPLAAVTLAKGGDRQTSRRLWQEIADGAAPDEEWLKTQAQQRLAQLDALDRIDALQRVARGFTEQTGRMPASWVDLIRSGLLPGVPIDPRGHQYQLNPYWGTVTLSADSPLNPLPIVEEGRP